MTTLTAIVIGATGAVGSALVCELLASEKWSKVIILTRRQTDQFSAVEGNSKLIQHVVNMDRLEQDTVEFSQGCDVAFCTLGVGQPSKFTKEDVWKVDVEYSSAFAKACHSAGVKQFSLLTAVYSNSSSRWSYYFRVKGTAEDKLRSLNFQRTSFFRPSLLATKNVRYGFTDFIAQNGFPIISCMLPSFLHEIKVEALGRAMRVNAEKELKEENMVEILHYKDFLKYL